jgi:hypothetical protein
MAVRKFPDKSGPLSFASFICGDREKKSRVFRVEKGPGKLNLPGNLPRKFLFGRFFLPRKSEGKAVSEHSHL